MSISGISSAYLAYEAVSSFYKLSKTSPVQEVQEISTADSTTSSVQDNEINDEAIISDEAKTLSASEENSTEQNSTTEKSSEEKTDTSNQVQPTLTPEQKQELAELKARDTEVKTHEQAHLAAASGLSASAPSYEYETGPDGNKYAVGGEVSISFTKSSDPKENIAKAQTMKAAALAPAQPSSQDLAVARRATSIILDAQQELIREQQVKMAEQFSESSNAQQTNVSAEISNKALAGLS